MIRNALLKIMSEYPDAITQSRVGHPLSSFIEKDAVSIIEKKLPSKYLSKNYFVHGSSGISNRWAGQGNGKRNPFIMIGNPKVTKTKTATKGFYVSYGFAFRDGEVGLSIGQSDWEINQEHKNLSQKQKNELLNSYANIMLNRLDSKTYLKEFKSGNVERKLRNGKERTLQKANNSNSGTVIYKRYNISDLPSEKALLNDLSLILDAYDEIYENGGRKGIEDRKIFVDDDFDPEKISKDKEKIFRSVSYRRGQKKFRDNLLRIYDSKCVMSGCKEKEVLQAAHILPYTDAETNKIDNGLLLRADLHNLFDLYLISINPKDFTILVSREIKDSDYRKLHGKKIKMPKNEIKSPSKKALAIHLKNFKG